MSLGRTLGIWGGGLALSIVFIWTVSALFLDRTAPKEHDPLLDRYVYRQGTTTAWRSEGWADTRYGRHGLTEPDAHALAAAGPKIILWGDSMVEALQLSPEQRIMPLFTNLMKGRLLGLAVGGGGKSVADYVFDIPAYERLSHDITAHVILVTNFEDTLPGQQVPGHATFHADTLKLTPPTATVSPKALRYWPIVHAYRLEFLYHSLYRTLREARLRFAPGRASQATPPHLARTAPEIESKAWSRLLQILKQTTRSNIVFLYAPPIPQLQLRTGAPALSYAEQAKRFAQACKAHGIDIIDLTPAFLRLYQTKGIFPRGFFNSPPGTGHFNKHGQRLIAEALAAYFREAQP